MAGKVTLLAGLTTPLSAGVPDANQLLKVAAVTGQAAWALLGIVWADSMPAPIAADAASNTNFMINLLVDDANYLKFGANE
jgi:hypothetical protein